jgi:chorismate--pyruvate lyase
VLCSVNRIQAPRWSPAARWRHGQIPACLRDWLLDAGSLTERLQRCCTAQFGVRVLDEGWQRPRVDEMRVLQLPLASLGWIRQVQLLCDSRHWVFARTVIPALTLSGTQRRLAYLGGRPLGAHLFADPGMRRGPVEVARIRPGQAMFAEALSGLRPHPAEIWGRRSVFWLSNKPLLVTEVFLPAVEGAS